ncbi:hypothetical protein HanRHA438_Chr10g0470931 [Helianthus annuus]|nr:hypothetical protein HanIR_Chr10g0493501 [Helianthus annuus]KAJ0881125.1 hypothetical protein HanRHA438_Chr10g0470931 [Helianthus annuus]
MFGKVFVFRSFISVFSFYILFKYFKIPTNKIFDKCKCVIYFVHERLFVFVCFMKVNLCTFVFINVRFCSLPKINEQAQTNTDKFISLTNEHEFSSVTVYEQFAKTFIS